MVANERIHGPEGSIGGSDWGRKVDTEVQNWTRFDSTNEAFIEKSKNQYPSSFWQFLFSVGNIAKTNMTALANLSIAKVVGPILIEQFNWIQGLGNKSGFTTPP